LAWFKVNLHFQTQPEYKLLRKSVKIPYLTYQFN
jgi:hypothetical protein